MINPGVPKHWKALQADVAQILSECGFQVESNKTITTVRGKVDIDVFALDRSQTPPVIYLCECKLWNSNVPKREVHAFRTVVNDFGANWGLIISKKGFQSGAFEAAINTNLRLFNWQEFQSLFADRWYHEYMVPILKKVTLRLGWYTEPINSGSSRKSATLSPAAQKRFSSLQKEYENLEWLALQLSLSAYHVQDKPAPALPLREHRFRELLESKTQDEIGIPEDVLAATSLRGLLDLLIEHLRTGIAKFDEVFGERA